MTTTYPGSLDEWCVFHPGQVWVIQAWNIGMQTREWLCRSCYEKRTTGPGQRYRYHIERDRDREVGLIRDEAVTFAREHPEEDQRLMEAGMQVFDRVQARLSEREVITAAQTRLTRSQETFPDDWRTRFTFHDGDVADVLAVIESLRGMVRDALATDGAHHKQWYLQQIALSLGVDGNDWPEGIAP